MGRVSQVQSPNRPVIAALFESARRVRSRPQFSRLGLCLIALAALALGTGCSSRVVKSANYQPVEQVNAAIPEAELLDVGIAVFDPGLDRALEDEDALLFPEVRKAESRYIPYQLVDALQRSAAWGAVRMVPTEEATTDVLLTGEIIESDGELLTIHLRVEDATGRKWFEQTYQGLASRYAYDRRANREKADPFQGLYNRIANDMLAYRKKLESQQLVDIRTVAEMRFAKSFAPEAYADHIVETEDGHYEIRRLPAVNDPMFQRIHRIRERDYLFIDTLQEYYGNFVRTMDGPYHEWRDQSYEEVVKVRTLERSARNRKIAGVAAIIGGIAAAGSSSGSTATAGQVGVVGGGYMVKSGFDKGSQAQIHVDALQELGDSLEAEIEPRVIELEDRTITLSGSVENQYNQWREILKDIYQAETQGTYDQGSANQNSSMR